MNDKFGKLFNPELGLGPCKPTSRLIIATVTYVDCWCAHCQCTPTYNVGFGIRRGPTCTIHSFIEKSNLGSIRKVGLWCVLKQRRIHTFSYGAKCSGSVGRSPTWAQAQNPRSGVQISRDEVPWLWRHFLISETNFLTKQSHKFGKFRPHGELGGTSAPTHFRCMRHIPTFHILLQSASADIRSLHVSWLGVQYRAIWLSEFYRT